MSTTHSDAGSVQIRLLDGPGPQQSLVSRAWLPMAVWDGTRVLVNTRQGLTVMEMFAIEALLTLGICGEADLRAIAALPAEIGGWILASLEQKRLAKKCGNFTYSPVEDACRQALASGCVVTQREERRAILCFPETNEYVVLPDADSVLDMLRDIIPMGSFHWPERLSGKSQSQILSDAISDGRLFGEDAHTIASVVETTELIEGLCPAYQVSTPLPPQGSAQWKLTFWGKARGGRGRAIQADTRNDRESPALIERSMQLPILPHLADAWKTTLDDAFSSSMAKLAVLGIGRTEIQNGAVVAAIDGVSAERFGRHHLLTAQTGMAVVKDRSIEFEIPLVLSPSDDSARSQFMVDDSVQAVLRASAPVEAIAAICSNDASLRAGMIDRMWALRLYRVIYDIREAEDFA
jgi:hypothetical protein